MRVEPGNAPMEVDSDAQVANLNADEVDGQSAEQIGVNGVGKVHVNSGLLDSVSFKTVTATCPDGKVVVGTGYDFTGATTGIFPDKLANVVVEEVYPAEASVHVAAYEEEPTNLAWSVTAIAIRATAP